MYNLPVLPAQVPVAQQPQEQTVLEIGDGETMSFENFPMPEKLEVDSRMRKREDDAVSGNMSYFETVSIIC